MKIHEKIRIVSYLFKQYLILKNIKDKFKLSSYAILNMIIYFLIENGYICSLHDKNKLKFDIKKITCTFYC